MTSAVLLQLKILQLFYSIDNNKISQQRHSMYTPDLCDADAMLYQLSYESLKQNTSEQVNGAPSVKILFKRPIL